ncbi:MAG: hypothetical protein ABH813_03085, partial [Patescibacteria group bacterium]
MPTISQQTQNLIGQYKSWYDSLQKKEDVATIHVDEVASQVAAIYEKIRGIIDWREEHLLRRGAIERILKRRLFLRIDEKVEARSFILELIRAGHFPNDKVEELKIEIVQEALDKYIFIVENSPQPKNEKNKIQLQNWLSTIAACEVEEILDPPRKERILIDYMAGIMKDRITLKNNLPEEEKNIQIYIAVQKALFKLDAPIITYHLLKRQFEAWRFLKKSESGSGSLEKITENIYSVWKDIDKKINHPLAEKFYRICERYDTPYMILGDILSQDPSGAYEKLNNPEALENDIKKFYQIKLKQQKSRVSRAAAYSTISIFVTKIFIAFLLEYLIIDKAILHQQPSWQTLGINIAIPPLLMLILVLSIRPPKKGNLEKVIVETMKITYEKERKDTYLIKSSYKKNPVMKVIISILFLITFLFTFWLFWILLDEINFTWPSKIVFVVFLSLIAFAGTKIKERAKELSIEEEKGGFFGFIIDWASLPFIQVGKWLSGQWTKYNTVLVFLTTLIDLPFQVLIEFLEQWRYFVKEKKEEIH